jgi:hypothetical protein
MNAAEFLDGPVKAERTIGALLANAQTAFTGRGHFCKRIEEA